MLKCNFYVYFMYIYIRICSHGGGVIALKWHTVHPLITTAALDNLVRVWDARSGTNLAI